MAMGRKARQRRQEAIWIAQTDLPRTVAHPFYEQLNRLLEERSFDEWVEQQCTRFYAERMGRPSLAPGRYFRLLLIGYFEGIDSERGIAWRAADSLALRSFLGAGLNEMPPDHSTISRTRRLIDVETHQAVFRWVLQLLAEKGLLKGKTVGIDATTLEANAALRSIVRRETGEDYQEFLRRLAQESGIATPTREQLAKLDRKRAHKGSNEDWVNPHDPEAGITKLMGSAVSFGGADHRERLRFLADVFPVRSDVLDGVAYHQSDRATEQRIQASNQCHGSDGR